MAGKKRGPARRKNPGAGESPGSLRGRPRQPSEVVALRQRRGTVNRRMGARPEVVPAEALPVLDAEAPPGALTDSQQRWWDILSSVLVNSKVLRVSDSAALLLLARNLGWMEDLYARIGEDTMVVVETEKGAEVRPNPFLVVYQGLERGVQKSLREFGLTPAARGRIIADVASGKKDMSIASLLAPPDDD